MPIDFSGPFRPDENALVPISGKNYIPYTLAHAIETSPEPGGPSNEVLLNQLSGYSLMRSEMGLYCAGMDPFYDLLDSDRASFNARANELVTARPETALAAQLSGAHLQPSNFQAALEQFDAKMTTFRAQYLAGKAA